MFSVSLDKADASLPVEGCSDSTSDCRAHGEHRLVKANGFVRIIQFGQHHANPSWTYVITHGMGGTKMGDRFHQLASEIQRRFPTANVFLVDWTQVAGKKNLFGLPSVWRVSAQIKTCGELAHSALSELSIRPHQTTFVGESFGNYVNFEVASRMKKVARMLCFNAAVKLGGYSIPDVTTVATDCYSFQTRSFFDTQQRLCHQDIRLKLNVGMKTIKGHTYGIRWLLETLRRSDSSWIRCSRSVPTATDTSFSGIAYPNGSFAPSLVPRIVKKRAGTQFMPRNSAPARLFASL